MLRQPLLWALRGCRAVMATAADAIQRTRWTVPVQEGDGSGVT